MLVVGVLFVKEEILVLLFYEGEGGFGEKLILLEGFEFLVELGELFFKKCFKGLWRVRGG